jgi:hypothetical protein
MESCTSSAGRSLDAACADVSVGESSLTVLLEGVPLSHPLGTPPRKALVLVRDVKDAPLSTHPEGRVSILKCARGA